MFSDEKDMGTLSIEDVLCTAGDITSCSISAAKVCNALYKVLSYYNM